MLTGECSDPISVTSTIRNQYCSRFQARHQCEYCEYEAVVERFVGSQGKAHGQSIGVDDCVSLAREATARPTHQLFSFGGDTGPCWCTRTIEASIICAARRELQRAHA
jgi:hypothetical protein